MNSRGDKSMQRLNEVLNALERCFLAGDSPGVKLAAGVAVELITGGGIDGRPLAMRTTAALNFAVSITLLSASMDEVLLRRVKQRQRLPRALISDQACSIRDLALSLSCSASGDFRAELALLGRPLAVELWDDEPEIITIGLNYLAISRSENLAKENDEWEFTQFNKIDLMAMDQRECLALSEMLSTMGIANPYDMSDDEERTPLNLTSAA